MYRPRFSNKCVLFFLLGFTGLFFVYNYVRIDNIKLQLCEESRVPLPIIRHFIWTRNGAAAGIDSKVPLGSNYAFPGYLKTLLQESEKLELVLVDGAALRCIFEDVDRQKQTCHALTVNVAVRIGTLAKNLEEFELLLKQLVLKDKRFKISGHFENDEGETDTVVLTFTNENNFKRFIFITVLGATGEDKNYYLLRGNETIPDVGIRKFEMESLRLDNLDVDVYVPMDLDLYLKYYDNGRFIQCNKEMAERLRNDSETRSIPLDVVKTLTIFIDDLMKTGQMAFLGGGTLLGWYRECGIIPHTTDLDFYVMSNQYPDKFENNFTTKLYTPYRRIGMKDYGFELSFWLKRNTTTKRATSVDVFYVFDHNTTTQWVSAMTSFKNLSRAKFLISRVYELCSAEIYGQLYFVHCNYMGMILDHYGPRWNESYEAGYNEKGSQVFDDSRWTSNSSDVLHYF